MTTFLLHGFNGKMGNAIRATISLSAKVCDIKTFDFGQSDNLLDSAIIDFSSAKALDNVLSYSSDNKLPIIIGTTGFSSEQIDKIRSHATKIPVFLSSNFSIGMNVLFEAVGLASKLMKCHDISIFEVHHRQKQDKPSGSALTLKEKILENIDSQCELNLEVNSFRGGGVRGEHTVMFCGQDEILKLTHEALDRKVFAAGAIAAAQWLLENKFKTGLFSMKDFLKMKLN